jgi:DNA repair exonuclease SbcCD nuclease subunit
LKIAVLADTHFGVRNDSQLFLEHTKSFFDQQFFPYLDREGITNVIVVGDLFDRRRYINIATLNFLRVNIFEPLVARGIITTVLAGNHDVYHANTLEVNSLTELLPKVYFRVIIKPEELFFGGVDCLFLPWICSGNEVECFEAIKTTQAKVCFAHLQLKGFEMHVGHYSDSGFDFSLFSKFDLVATGHFHHKSSNANIHYLGPPYQMTWADYNDPRGFHIFDTETLKLEYVENSNEIFFKIVYDDKDKSLEEVMNWNFERFDNCFIKVLVKHKANPYWFDMFIGEVEKYAADLKVVEEMVHIGSDVSIEECESTIDILKKCIEETNVEQGKNELEKFLVQLYNEAQTLEV